MPSPWPAMDAVLLLPFRAVPDPLLGYLLGCAALGLLAALASRATLALAHRAGGESARTWAEEARRWQQVSLEALAAGDGEAYRACNGLANEAFGRAFFLTAAWGMGALWPAFLAAAWLAARFDGVVFPLGLVNLGPVAPLVVAYLGWRWALGSWAARRRAAAGAAPGRGSA